MYLFHQPKCRAVCLLIPQPGAHSAATGNHNVYRIRIVLKSHVCEGSGMIGGDIHVVIQLFLKIPVIARIPNDHLPAYAIHGEVSDQPATMLVRDYSKQFKIPEY